MSYVTYVINFGSLAQKFTFKAQILNLILKRTVKFVQTHFFKKYQKSGDFS